MLGLALAGLLLLSACGTSDGIVTVIDDDEQTEERAGAYTPGNSSALALDHADGQHDALGAVEIGPGGAAAGSTAVTSPSPATSTPSVKPGTGAGTAPRAAASPTTPPRLNLGAALGASASGAAPASDMLMMDGQDEELGTVNGKIEGAVGSTLTVRTETGQARVHLENGARIERDTSGSAADLKPGQFIGVLQLPGGPAMSIRLYNTGASMPPAGIIPMIGSRVGQVTTFGTIVGLQFGGLQLNAGSQTISVTLPNTVEIMKPAPATAADLGAGAQIIASGPLAADGTVNATAVRVTAAPPRVLPPAASPQALRRP